MSTSPDDPISQERAEWHVPVLDAVFRRECELIIAVAGTDVVVAPPTSAGYVIPPSSERKYDEAMRAARTLAEGLRKKYGQSELRSGC